MLQGKNVYDKLILKFLITDILKLNIKDSKARI